MFRIHVPVSQLQREFAACYAQHHVVQSRCTRTNVGVTCRGQHNGPQQPTDAPWKLMGRVVTEDTIRISREQKYMLISSAAATASGLSNEEFDSRLQDVITLLPDIRERLLSLKPQFLAELCTDPAAVAMKLLKLRELFPLANISMMVARRPLLLLDEHFSQVAEAHAKLHAMFPEGGVDQMVEQQPLMLAADVDHTVGELERLLGQGASRLLLTQPQLILSVMNNAPLSLWLMPGVDIRIMLLRNPAMLLSVQRGSDALGPPAEVMMGPYPYS